MPTSGTAANVNVFTVTVNDTKPLWFYCSQGAHCEAGMAMVINEPYVVSCPTLLASPQNPRFQLLTTRQRFRLHPRCLPRRRQGRQELQPG